jgi:hypothetical protein
MKCWFMAGSHPSDYEQGIDSSNRYHDQKSAFVRANIPHPSGFGTLMQMFKADLYRNKRMRFSGVVKSEGVDDWAGLWMRVDGPGKESLRFDNMQTRPIVGTTEWQRYRVILDVPEEATNVAFGILLGGKGQVWLSDVQFEETEEEPTGTASHPEKPGNLDFSEE